VGKTIRMFRNRALSVPRRDRFGDVAWRQPSVSMLTGILKNPAYAGAFVYGRTRSCQARYPNGKLITTRCSMEDWKIVVKDRYPAYIDWETFVRIQTMLRDNHADYQRRQTRGVPREGAVALQGIVWCGQCGHKMKVQYSGGNRYICNFLLLSHGGPLCQHLPADLIDERVITAFFAAVGPTELDAWQQARDARQQTDEALDRAEAQQVERLRYQTLLAERQYNRVDPDNRLIAAELERRWETALRELRQAEEALARRRAAKNTPEALTSQEQDDFLALGPQLPELWQRADVTWADKKAFLRSLIDKVVLQRVARDQIVIRIVWRGGEVSNLAVEPRVHALSALSRGVEMEARLLDLARKGVDDATIAEILTQEGHRSARRSYVPVRTVQVVRQRHRVLQNSAATRARHIRGWLTITEIAKRLNISREWIKRRIHNGTIAIQLDPYDKRYLFPDTPETIAALQDIKAGLRRHLLIAPRPNK
jgi:hypothetical protein